MTKQEILKQYFGYDSFRNGQESLIDAVLSGKDVIGVMPTGGGKSLCYQVPALLMDGVTFVVSPLISLMQDQVIQLKAAGVPAAYVNSSLTPAQIDKVYANIIAGRYRIIYVAPERLDTAEFARMSRGLNISLLAVDEAHCISQWGQDFRPSYLKITDYLKGLPRRPVVAAYTATATGRVRDDIEAMLGLREPLRVVTSFDRPNLSFDVSEPKKKGAALYELVSQRRGRSGIIYCSTRRNVERVCEALCEKGVLATRYHAGLSDDERTRNQEDFLYDRKPVMVATNAFGMGINKSNVSYVIHYNMPKSIEEYYQEAGRAGRDGEAAECILLYGKSDVMMAKRLISGTEDGELMTDEELWQYREKEMTRLSQMIDYCKTTQCLRGKILDYFGQEHGGTCGNCGNCKGGFVERDITVEAQKILSCTVRIRQKLGYSLGKTLVIAVLRGRKSERIRELGLDTLRTYGIMKDNSRQELDRIFDFLAENGYIGIDGRFQSAAPGEKADGVLYRGARVVMSQRKKTDREQNADGKSKAKRRREQNAAAVEMYGSLYDELRELRAKLAMKENVPAYVVFTNASLADMAAKKPSNICEFLGVSGVGQNKAERYGSVFIEKIAEFERRNADGNTETSEEVSQKTPVKEQPAESGARSASVKGLPDVKKADKEPRKGDPANIYSLLLSEAFRVLSETDTGDGLRPRVTVFYTESGTAYSAVNCDRPNGISFDERKVLHRLEKNGDTLVQKMLTLWQDGTVGSAAIELYKAVYAMNTSSADAEVLIAKTPRNIYKGSFFPENYRLQKLKSFLI